MQRVTIIVPVYNAFEETRACLESVLAHSPAASCSILVIDDCSPAGELAEALPQSILADKRLQLVRNDLNLGFVGTCNRGMLELSGSDDVILLNSDTEVTARWVEKLRAAAYARPEIATVTPLTNNGTICSFPKFAADNPLVPGSSLDEFADLVERVSAREYPELPTCVGFCTYIKREIIRRLNGFDADAFGRGYGEENDFSCRAQALGFVDVLDDATFIYHKGSMSFLQSRTELQKKNSEVLRQRHPLYFDNVSRFCRAAPLQGVHSRIFAELLRSWNESKRLSVLHILHNGPYVERHHPVGGTERHVQDIINAVPDAAHWSLTPSPQAYYLTAHLGYADREFILDRASTTLYDILKIEHFDLVHMQHIQGFQYGELDAALRQHGNYVVSLHDFNMICPRVYLMTPYRKHCTGFECASQCSFGAEYISEYRKIAKDLLEGARGAVCFSESTKTYFERIIAAKAQWHIQPHGIEGLRTSARLLPEPPARPCEESPLRVAFVGYLPQHKGSLIIEKLLQETRLASGVPLEWHIVGELYGNSPERVHQHGSYQRKDLAATLQRINPHLICILSLCPETYSLTLDEAWNAGVPVLSTPLGAPAERVQRTGAGWIVRDLDADMILRQLAEIAADWDGYLAARSRVETVPLVDTFHEGAAYGELYRRNVPQRRANVSAVLNRFAPVALARPPEPGFRKRVLRFGVNTGIRTLERLRMRPAVERLLYSIIPTRVLEGLKGLR